MPYYRHTILECHFGQSLLRKSTLLMSTLRYTEVRFPYLTQKRPMMFHAYEEFQHM